uniref:Ig-like domain-containing protein n=1 Tax=Phasianus colchicus TaxID=9054 RepID=A0A669QKN4_PHACC
PTPVPTAVSKLLLPHGTNGAGPHLPRPSLSLHLSQWVSLGDNVTLRCHLPRSAAQVELYTEGYWWYVKQADMDMVQDTAEFLLVSVERKDAVKYHCRYRVLEPPGTSEKSDPVEQVVTADPTGPCPIQPGEQGHHLPA